MREKKSLTLFELLIVLCTIFILMGVFAGYANTAVRVSRELALQSELNNIRMSITHYRIINGVFPESLLTLMNKSFTLKISNDTILSNGYLKPFRVNKYGVILDPFFNKYIYDCNSGIVKSQTKGYENW